MQNYIFLDLDDTLFQSLRKCTYETDASRLQARAFLIDGSPNSYATHKQQWLWQWLSKGFRIVPVTGRSRAAFERVHLPFQEEIVLNHGATILTCQRTVDSVWLKSLEQTLPDYQDKLLHLWDEIGYYIKLYPGYNCRLIHDFELSLYGIIKHIDRNETPLKELLDTIIKKHPNIIDGSLYWHLNDNNLAILPKIINKKSAVDYLLANYRKQHPELLTFGAGDSKTDLPFMTLCDYALIPNNTQLFKSMVSFK